MRTVKLHQSTAVYFDSPREFAETIEREGVKRKSWTTDTWAGGDWQTAVRECRDGAEKYAHDVTAMIDSIPIAVPRSAWVPSPAGAFPIVPEYLAGRPDPMRRRVQVCAETAPIRMFLDLVSSQEIDEADLRKRGASFLALAMALVQVRPVELYATIPDRPTQAKAKSAVSVIRLATAPLDTAAVAAVFCNPAITRHLGYAYVNHLAGVPESGLDWYRGIYPTNEARSNYVDALRADLGLAPGDVYLPPAYYGDEAISNPRAFVERGIREYAATIDAA